MIFNDSSTRFDRLLVADPAQRQPTRTRSLGLLHTTRRSLTNVIWRSAASRVHPQRRPDAQGREDAGTSSSFSAIRILASPQSSPAQYMLNRLRTTISGCIVIEAMLVDMKGPRATAAHGQYVSFVLSAGHHLYGRKETDLLRRSHRAINKG